MNEREFQAGSTVGRYRVLEPLGPIGLAERYRVAGPDGVEAVLGVLDVVHPDIVPMLRSLQLESVHHPNVVEVREVVAVGRRAAVVTGPLPGVTLKERLASGPVSEGTALAWVRCLLDALEALHAAGFVHRDVRPDTILVDGDHATLLDHGIPTAIFSLVSGGRSVTTSGTTIGRPHYWAPERARRPASADARADLYSLGCVTYEVFAGIGPFAGLNLYDCYHASLEGRYPPLAERRKGLPPHVATFVVALLRARPEHRAQTATEAREILDGQRQVTATPAPQTLAAAPPAPRPPPRTLLVAGGVGFLVLLAAVWWWVAG